MLNVSPDESLCANRPSYCDWSDRSNSQRRQRTASAGKATRSRGNHVLLPQPTVCPRYAHFVDQTPHNGNRCVRAINNTSPSPHLVETPSARAYYLDDITTTNIPHSSPRPRKLEQSPTCQSARLIRLPIPPVVDLLVLVVPKWSREGQSRIPNLHLFHVRPSLFMSFHCPVLLASPSTIIVNLLSYSQQPACCTLARPASALHIDSEPPRSLRHCTSLRPTHQIAQNKKTTPGCSDILLIYHLALFIATLPISMLPSGVPRAES